jgi:hypothetical protein
LKKTELQKEWRKTGQYLLPGMKPSFSEGRYDIYPAFKLEDNQISEGFASLARVVSKHRTVTLEGYAGVFYNEFREKIDEHLKALGLKTSWKNTSDFLKTPEIIEEMISPFMGGDDPLFGKRTELDIEDFFDMQVIRHSEPDKNADINFITGPGASLAGCKGLLAYIIFPRMRYNSVPGQE